MINVSTSKIKLYDTNFWNNRENWSLYYEGEVVTVKNVIENVNENPMKKDYVIFTSIKCEFANFISNHLSILINILSSCQSNHIRTILEANVFNTCLKMVGDNLKSWERTLTRIINVVINSMSIVSNLTQAPIFLETLLSLYYFTNKYEKDVYESEIDNDRDRVLIELNTKVREISQIQNQIENFRMFHCNYFVPRTINMKNPNVSTVQLLKSNSDDLDCFLSKGEISEIENRRQCRMENVLLEELLVSDDNQGGAFKEIRTTLVRKYVDGQAEFKPFTERIKRVKETYEIATVFRLQILIVNIIMKLVFQKSVDYLEKISSIERIEFSKFREIRDQLKRYYFPRNLIYHFEMICLLEDNEDDLKFSVQEILQTTRAKIDLFDGLNTDVPESLVQPRLELIPFMNEMLGHHDALECFTLIFSFFQESKMAANMPPGIALEVQDIRYGDEWKSRENQICDALAPVFEICYHVQWIIKRCESDSNQTRKRAEQCFNEIRVAFKDVRKYLFGIKWTSFLIEKNDDVGKLVDSVIYGLQNNISSGSTIENSKRLAEIITNLIDNYGLKNCHTSTYDYTLLDSTNFNTILSLNEYRSAEYMETIFDDNVVAEMGSLDEYDEFVFENIFGQMLEINETKIGVIFGKQTKFHWNGIIMDINEIYRNITKTVLNTRNYYKFYEISLTFIISTICYVTVFHIQHVLNKHGQYTEQDYLIVRDYSIMQNTFFQEKKFPPYLLSFIDAIKSFQIDFDWPKLKPSDVFELRKFKDFIEMKLEEFGVKNTAYNNNTDVDINRFTVQQMFEVFGKIYENILKVMY